MKTCSIFYTDSKFRVRETPLLNKMKDVGFDQIINYRREWLETTEFYLENKEILDMSRGNGYWLWKPYIILETMKVLDNGDIIFYMDAGDDITNNNVVNIIKNHMINNDYMIGGLSRRPINKKFIKRDCFILMNCDEEKYHNKPQIEAGVLAFKKTQFIIDLLNEWLFFSKNKNIVTDLPNIHGENYPEFIDHRHDQSILSNLTIKYGMEHNDLIYSVLNYNMYIPQKK